MISAGTEACPTKTMNYRRRVGLGSTESFDPELTTEGLTAEGLAEVCAELKTD